MECTDRAVRKRIGLGQLACTQRINAQNRPEYAIPLSALPTEAQLRYYERQGRREPKPDAQSASRTAPPHASRPLDSFSAAERAEIGWWMETLAQWHTCRSGKSGGAAQIDEAFVSLLRQANPDRPLSVKTLYRKDKALRENRLEGLVDSRGKARRGRSAMDETVWQTFLGFYLDLRQPPALACYEDTVRYVRKHYPELADGIPSYGTFLRHVERDVPVAVRELGRSGKKAMRDRCAPYVHRVYDNMDSNEVWVADNHTFDIISRNGETTHRLYLTAFLDARSGIFTGLYVTTTPSSQSTVIALRRGIQRYGIPDTIYVDNGREFLTFDLGGLGHRAKQSKAGEGRHDPPTILQRLGIEMINAQVRNARAKIIERRFLDVKNRISRLFESFTGGNVLEKPENLERLLRAGKGPTDKELTEAVELLLEGYLNEQPYGGAVAKDRGKPRIQVYHENLHCKRVPKNEDDLSLMLMRSTRARKVDRAGVYLTMGGTRLYYRTDEFVLHYQNKQVYLRYDPLDLSHVRAYDLEDRFLAQLPADNKAVLTYRAGAEQIKEAQRSIRGFEKKVGEAMASMTLREIEPTMRLALALEEAQANMDRRDGETRPAPKLIELQPAYEQPVLKAAVGDIDLDRMIHNMIDENGGYDDE